MLHVQGDFLVIVVCIFRLFLDFDECYCSLAVVVVVRRLLSELDCCCASLAFAFITKHYNYHCYFVELNLLTDL